MHQYKIEKITGGYNPDILLPIWKSSLQEIGEERIKWSYEENPDGKAQLYLINDMEKHQYFGSCAVIARKFHFAGRELRGGVTADFAVKREYRMLGSAIKLQKAIANSDDLEILIGFPNKTAEKVQMRAGYEVLANMVRYLKVLNAAQVLKRRFHPLAAYAAVPFAALYLKMKSFRLKGNQGSQSCAASLDERVAQIFEYAEDVFDFSGSRNLDYLKWRFLKCPYKSYSVFCIEDRVSSQLAGYLIYYMENNIAYIDDFFCRGFDRYLEEMLETFTAHCGKMKLDAVSLMMAENSALDIYFKKAGFLSEMTDHNILYFYKDILRNKNVFLTAGDRDI
ncbi:MAG: hypothetical protein HZB61_02070 [Nitrospirae bacterium]|nr:hypothetical protein [Nitrospirota bacterium]